MSKSRGPYNRYLEQGSGKSAPRETKRRNILRQERNRLQHDEQLQREQQLNEATGSEENHQCHDDGAPSSEHQEQMTLSDTNVIDDNSVEMEDGVQPHPNPLAFEEDQEPDLSDCEFSSNTHIPFQFLRDFLQTTGHKKDFVVRFNVAEIILMVLTMSLVHNLSLSAICDFMKLLNLWFATSLFPETAYFVKKMFNPTTGMKIHYTCEFCGHYLGSKGDRENTKSWICANCKVENVIDGYRYENTFVTLDVKSQIIDLLNDPACKFYFDHNDQNEHLLSDIQTGSVYRGKECISGGSNQKFLTCNFNIDGSPISKDGKTSVTPIYLMLNELHFKSRGKNLILAGLWYGKVKPRIDIFLKPFTMQMDDLRTKGFSVTCNGESILYKVICLCCVVDSVARPPLQGIKAVNGYYCCSWCQIKGEYVDETNVKYPFVIPDPPLRNEINFKACCESLQSGENDKDALLGITTASPLINLTSFSMVWGFCPDFPHMIPLGIVRRMLECWLRDVGKPYYIGTGKQLEAMDKLMTSIKVPTLIKRDPVPLTMRRVMKSKELENFLLYFSVPVLQGYLPDQYFKHWKLLVEGVSILLQDVITPTEINTAELSLLEYVCKVEKYYGKFEMTYNVHQLLHLAESVRRFGPIWSHTSYPFESALGTLKKLLKTSKGVPQQIVRNIEMNRATTLIVSNYDISEPVFDMCNVIQDYRLVRASVTENDEKLFGIPSKFECINIEGVPKDVQFLEYGRVVKNSVVFSKQNLINLHLKKEDCFVELHNGMFAIICHVLSCEGGQNICYVIVKKVLCEDEPYLTLTKRIIGFGCKVAIKLSEVKCVAAHVNVDQYNHYITYIPMKHNLLNM